MGNKTFSRCVYGWGLLCLSLFMVFKVVYAQEGAINKNNLGKNYALIIGIENYKNWPPPTKAISNAVSLGNELEKMGFDVTYRSDLDLIGIEAEVKKFLCDGKINEQSNLFFWFSGYGDNIGEEGFLVPINAPKSGEPGFKTKMFPIRRFEEYLQLTKAQHVFMVFDSCFFNAIFRDDMVYLKEKTVSEMRKYPVHRYLYYLSKNQQREYDSAFWNMFIKTLRNENKADADEDNILTAIELYKKMMNFSKNQQLKFGKLKLRDKNQGEFVFSLPGQSRIEYKSDPLKDGGEGPRMIIIPGGSFMMGDSQGNGFRDEKPVHLVSISRIAVSRCEMTFDEYELFCKKNNHRYPGNKISGDRPVTYVSWEDAVAYTKWLSEQTGFKYRLPTEAEWEYFARAGTDTDYWWGNELVNATSQNEAKAACDGCGAQWGWDAKEKTTAPVKSFKANPFGIYDTVGNVWEWTCSEYTPGYNESKKEEKCLDKIKTGGELVVLRGGAWNEKTEHCRVSRRKAINLGERSADIGFRVVKELE